MEIYWIQDKKQRGPASVPDVLSLVKMGELSRDTLGWHAGCKAWVPLGELPALVDFLSSAAPEPELPPIPEPGKEPSAAESSEAEPPNAVAQVVYMPSPFCRLVARVVDVGLFLALVYMALYIRQVSFSPEWMPGGAFIGLTFMLTEALLLHFFGTTPGKALFGIRMVGLTTGQPEPISFLRALLRSSLVFFMGMGMMLSFFPLIMGGFSYLQLRRRGITLWDARVAVVPSLMRPVGWGKVLLGLALAFFCLRVIAVCMEPWMPAMLDSIAEQSPETADMLRKMMAKP